ncbi:hypothetical protein Gpo141_00014745, partial [Globisporangium polare]
LTRLPSFDGLSNLKSLTLAVLTSVQDLSSLEPLKKLATLQLLFLASLQSVPDVETLPKLSNVLVNDAPICCNGVLGRCNSSISYCSSGNACVAAGNPSGDERQHKLDQLLERFSQTVCSWYIPDLSVLTLGPTKEQVDICDGVMYRQCTLPGAFDTMCFSNRMQAIACNSEAITNIQIRQKQIQQRVGTPCDPVGEQWLGCTKR